MAATDEVGAALALQLTPDGAAHQPAMSSDKNPGILVKCHD